MNNSDKVYKLVSTTLACQAQLFKKPKMEVEAKHQNIIMEAPAWQEVIMEVRRPSMEVTQPGMEISLVLGAGLGPVLRGCQPPGGGGACCSSRSRVWGSLCVGPQGNPSGVLCGVEADNWLEFCFTLQFSLCSFNNVGVEPLSMIFMFWIVGEILRNVCYE